MNGEENAFMHVDEVTGGQVGGVETAAIHCLSLTGGHRVRHNVGVFIVAALCTCGEQHDIAGRQYLRPTMSDFARVSIQGRKWLRRAASRRHLE